MTHPTDTAPLKPVAGRYTEPTDERLAELSLEFCRLEPLSDFDYIGFARAAIALASSPAPAEALPPLPEWSKRDDLGGLVPSEIRSQLREYARAAIDAAMAAQKDSA